MKCHKKHEPLRRSELNSTYFCCSQILLLSSKEDDHVPMVISRNGKLFYFEFEVNILCKVKPIQVYNSIMRKNPKWTVHVVLFFKMSIGSVVVGGMMELIDARKLF